MNLERQIKQLELARKRSKRALPVYAFVTVGGIYLIWELQLTMGQSALVLLFTAGFLIGDLVNVVYCGRKLRELRGRGEG